MRTEPFILSVTTHRIHPAHYLARYFICKVLLISIKPTADPIECASTALYTLQCNAVYSPLPISHETVLPRTVLSSRKAVQQAVQRIYCQLFHRWLGLIRRELAQPVSIQSAKPSCTSPAIHCLMNDFALFSYQCCHIQTVICHSFLYYLNDLVLNRDLLCLQAYSEIVGRCSTSEVTEP